MLSVHLFFGLLLICQEIFVRSYMFSDGFPHMLVNDLVLVGHAKYLAGAWQLKPLDSAM